MAEEQTGQERTEQPTERRLQEARRKGQVPRSRELNTLMVLLSSAAALWVMGSWIVGGITELVAEALSPKVEIMFDKTLLGVHFIHVMISAVTVIAPFLLVTLAAALIGPASMGGLVFSAEAITFKLDKIDPIKGLGRIFAVKGLVELVKTLLKFCLVAFAAILIFLSMEREVLSLSSLDIFEALRRSASLMAWALIVLSATLILVVSIDVPFQLYEHNKQLKMTRQEIKDEMKEAMISAAQSTGAGNLPGAIQRMIQELTEPKMDWREIIQQQIVSTMKSDYTFMKPSRRSWHMDAILPGMINTDKIDICLALDASGSISEDMCREFLSEVRGIMEQYKDFRIHLWSFDTAVFNPQVFTPDNADEIEDYVLGSGGGTEFECNWEFMKAEGIEPKKFIMFTDGWPFDSWGDPDYCDTVFLINNKYERNIEAPFGLTVTYED